jgi:hypothetical protein
MRQSEMADISQLSDEESNILFADFTEQEEYDAIMQMEKNKTPRSDRFLLNILDFYRYSFFGRVMVTNKNMDQLSEASSAA